MGKLDLKLAKAAKMFSKTAKKVESAPVQGEWEDGRYPVQINKCSMNESQASGRLQVSFVCKGLEEAGEYKGAEILHHQGIETEQGQEFLFKDFRVLGYNAPENEKEMKALIAKIDKEKPMAMISVKTKGDFQNVRFLRKLDAAGAADASAEAEGTADESETEAEGETEATPGQVELVVGLKVETTLKSGTKFEGEVIEILEKEQMVRVQDGDGKKFKVSFDQIEPIEDVPAEPAEEAESESEAESEAEAEPAPKAKAPAKAAAKPAIAKKK